MSRASYLFEAKGIQRWVMEGGRLRDIAAASDILARVSSSDGNDLLQDALTMSGFTDVAWSRRAGGAFVLHFAEADAAFERFRALWRLVFMQLAPGLEFVETFGAGADNNAARIAVYEEPTRRAAGRENGFASLLPQGHPLVQLAQRTGRPAVRAQIYPGEAEQERIDLVTNAKRNFVPKSGVPGVGDRFLSTDPGGAEFKWPTEMDLPSRGDGDGSDTHGGTRDDTTLSRGSEFPFEGDSRWIGVVHADISGLGAFYRGINAAAATKGDRALEFARKASEAIEEALTAAARIAGELLVDRASPDTQILPARPILLGGDDVTIIVRGDLALDWTESFLKALEMQSKQKLSAFAEHFGEKGNSAIDTKLTAAAGVAFGKSKQPFFRLLELADSLCGFAKRAAKEVAKKEAKGRRAASMIAFHRVTESALAKDADALFAELEQNGRRLSAQPYAITENVGLYAKLEDLKTLKTALGDEALKRGAIRELRKLLLSGDLDGEAEEVWRRWCEMTKKRSAERFEAFTKDLIFASGGPVDSKLPFAEAAWPSLKDKTKTVHPSPLFDAIEWEAIS